MRNAQIEIAEIAGQMDSLRQAFEMQIAELRDRQVELAEQLKAMQHAVSALESKPVVRAATPTVQSPKPAPRPEARPSISEGISEEVMLVIAAAVAAFLGKSARVRSARYLQEGMSPWAQQGRVFVQASHNLAHHG